jgi:hypothetical protein
MSVFDPPILPATTDHNGAAPPRRRGRPRMHPDSVKRTALSLRTKREVRLRLDQRAAANARSLTQEVEFILDAWLALEQAIGAEGLPALVLAMAAIGRDQTR